MCTNVFNTKMYSFVFLPPHSCTRVRVAAQDSQGRASSGRQGQRHNRNGRSWPGPVRGVRLSRHRHPEVVEGSPHDALQPHSSLLDAGAALGGLPCEDEERTGDESDESSQ